MPTYSEVRLRLAQLCSVGASLDMLDGWIVDRYQAILDATPFRRVTKRLRIQTVAEYATGTVDVTEGLATIAGTLTVWTAAMSGRMIRIANSNEWYTFTYVSAVSGTLDRPYEGTTAAGATYRINQGDLPMPIHVRKIDAIATPDLGELARVSDASLMRTNPGRSIYGAPISWAPWFDALDSQGIRRMWVALDPVPDSVEVLEVSVVSDADGLTSGDTAQVLLPWIRPAAIIAGVQADYLRWRASMDLAQAAPLLNTALTMEQIYDKRLRDILAVAASERTPGKMEIADRYARHDIKRWAGTMRPNDRW